MIRLFALLAALVCLGAACAPPAVECVYAPTCRKYCGGPILRSGCTVSCGPGEVEDLDCRADAGTDGGT